MITMTQARRRVRRALAIMIVLAVVLVWYLNDPTSFADIMPFLTMMTIITLHLRYVYAQPERE